MKLDIKIPKFDENAIGGPITFLKNLFDCFEKSNIQLSLKSKHIFFPIEYDLKKLEEIKKSGGQIIQRLDGIYYPEKHDGNYLELNSHIKEIYQNYSTHIIFQSEYSKSQCFSMFGKVENYDIIYNGANLEIFYPSEKKAYNQTKTTFITTGNFRNIDMIEPVILALDMISDQYEFELCVLGPFPNEELKKYLNRSYVRYLGETTDKKLIAKYLRDSDAFIYSHLNPPCPNSVIEAISCGLPIIGFDSGSMSELCSFSKELLAFVSSDIFQTYEMFDYKKLAEVIEKYLLNKEKYKAISMQNWKKFNMERCAESYVETFKNLCGTYDPTIFKRIKEFIKRS
jgi:glycosyltransferase involved in cell wall biosynthesis